MSVSFVLDLSCTLMTTGQEETRQQFLYDWKEKNNMNSYLFTVCSNKHVLAYPDDEIVLIINS